MLTANIKTTPLIHSRFTPPINVVVLLYVVGNGPALCWVS